MQIKRCAYALLRLQQLVPVPRQRSLSECLDLSLQTWVTSDAYEDVALRKLFGIGRPKELWDRAVAAFKADEVAHPDAIPTLATFGVMVATVTKG